MSTANRIGAMLIGAVTVHALLLPLTSYAWYAGGSATLYGLFAFTALGSGIRGGLVLVALLLGMFGVVPVADYSFPVARESHWMGFAVGTLAAVAAYIPRPGRSSSRARRSMDAPGTWSTRENLSSRNHRPIGPTQR